MDHNELLSIVWRVGTALQSVVQERQKQEKIWHWVNTIVTFPESQCPFCYARIQSNSLWVLSGIRNERLLGIIKVANGTPFKLLPGSHPNSWGGRRLCLGTHRDGIGVITSPANIHDDMMSDAQVRNWLTTYWDHTCDADRPPEGTIIPRLQPLTITRNITPAVPFEETEIEINDDEEDEE